MKNRIYISKNTILRAALMAIAVLAIPTLAHAQTGCTDSPENPTVVLALVGSAGALFSAARSRFKARRNSREK
jgi:XrtJ-associated TM-motif-TM protein